MNTIGRAGQLRSRLLAGRVVRSVLKMALAPVPRRINLSARYPSNARQGDLVRVGRDMYRAARRVHAQETKAAG